MIYTKKSDRLLCEIAKKAGVNFLPVLRDIHSSEALFSLLDDIVKTDFTIEEWKYALTYILGLNTCLPDTTEKCREIILWNTGQWGQYITEIMENYFTAHRMTGCFYYVTGNYGPKLLPEKKYLIFYHSSNFSRAEAMDFAKGDQINVSFVAICDDYHDGIQSMEQGDCYALKLPLEEDKVIRCYEHFNSNYEKESIV